MDTLKYTGTNGFQLVDSTDSLVANNYLGTSGFQPLMVASLTTPVAPSYVFVPYIITTDIYA